MQVSWQASKLDVSRHITNNVLYRQASNSNLPVMFLRFVTGPLHHLRHWPKSLSCLWCRANRRLTKRPHPATLVDHCAVHIPSHLQRVNFRRNKSSIWSQHLNCQIELSQTSAFSSLPCCGSSVLEHATLMRHHRSPGHRKLCRHVAPVHVDALAKLWIFFEIPLQSLSCPRGHTQRVTVFLIDNA